MKSLRILSGLSIFLLVACAPAAVDLDAARASLQEAVEAYHQAASAADGEAVLALYAADGAMMPPNEEDYTGTARVRQQVEGFTSLEDFQFDAETPTVVVSAGGEMGYSVAAINLSWTDAGETISERLRDVHIWTRAEDGSWQLMVYSRRPWLHFSTGRHSVPRIPLRVPV